MYDMGGTYVVSVAHPLELTITIPAKSRNMEHLGEAIMAQVKMLQLRGFTVDRLMVDPERYLLALENKIPGLFIDPVGAGDHLHKVDARIRRLKDIMRTVIADLPYSLLLNRIDDLVIYATKCKNARKTKALNDNVAPRVRFIGINIDFKKEYKLKFGDYVKAYNPAVTPNTTNLRTDPCIVLYPAGSVSRSWIFWNMKSKKYVGRSNYTKLVVSNNIVNYMNALAGTRGISTIDQL